MSLKLLESTHKDTHAQRRDKYAVYMGYKKTKALSTRRGIGIDIDHQNSDEKNIREDIEPVKRGHKKYVYPDGIYEPRKVEFVSTRKPVSYYDKSTELEHAGTINDGTTASFVVTLHGGYITTINEKGNVESETTVYNHNRMITHLAPLGTSARITKGMSVLMTQMIFKLNIHPIIAAKYVFTEDFMASETKSSQDNGDSKPWENIYEHLDKLYQCYKTPPGTRCLIKHYRRDFPLGIRSSVFPAPYGYADVDPASPFTGINYIGIVYSGPGSYATNSGYFLLNDIDVYFEEHNYKTLECVIGLVNGILGGDFFAEMHAAEVVKAEDGRNIFKIHYPIGFDMSQCKYFIASMIAKTLKHDRSPLEENIYKEEDHEMDIYYITMILQRHIIKEKDATNYHIPNYESSEETAPWPFLVRSLDNLSDHPETYAFTEVHSSYKTTQRDPIKESINIKTLAGANLQPEPVSMGNSSGVEFYQWREPHEPPPQRLQRQSSQSQIWDSSSKIALNTNRIHTSVTYDPTYYKLSLFEFSEADISRFICKGKENRNDVLFEEYQFNCSYVSFPEIPEEDEQYHAKKYFKKYSKTARGSMKSKSKTRRKYKKKTRRIRK